MAAALKALVHALYAGFIQVLNKVQDRLNTPVSPEFNASIREWSKKSRFVYAAVLPFATVT